MATAELELDEGLRLRLRLEELATEYAHCIDDDRLEEWPDFFAKDALYRVTSRENQELDLPVGLIHCEGKGMLRDRISAMRVANVFGPHTYCHMMSAMMVTETVAGGHRTKSNFMVMRTMSDGDMSVFATGRYLDHVVEEAGQLKYRERVVILDSKRVDTLLIIPL